MLLLRYVNFNFRCFKTFRDSRSLIPCAKFSISSQMALNLKRHAQTQHGDASVDEENIVLLPKTLFVDNDSKHQADLNSSQSVWFYDIGKEQIEEKNDELSLTSPSDKLISANPENNEQLSLTSSYDKDKMKLLIPEKSNQLSVTSLCDEDKSKSPNLEKRKAEDCEQFKDSKKAKVETKVLRATRPGFTDEKYSETSYYYENGLRKVYPYYFTFTTFTKGRWVGEEILKVFAREFRAQSVDAYERSIKAGKLTINYEKVPITYKLKHNDLLLNTVHRHEVPVTSQPITIVFMDDDIVVVDKPPSIPVHPCGRYRHNTVVFILAKEYNLKNLRTIHRLDRLTSGLLMFGRSPKQARQMEHHIRNRQVQKEYVCRVDGDFPEGVIECNEPIEVVSYKIGVCKVSSKGKDCTTTFEKIANSGSSSIVLCKPLTGRMHQIRVHLQYLGYPIVNDPLYNHEVFGPLKGRGGDTGGKTSEELVRDLINIHNAENWLGLDSDSNIPILKTIKGDCDIDNLNISSDSKNNINNADAETPSRQASPSSMSPHTAPTSTAILDKNESSIESVPNASMESMALVAALAANSVTVATQTGHESPDISLNADKLTTDQHCAECKLRYNDPKPKDLVMYLHAWKYRGPGWQYETDLPDWASTDWTEPKYDD